jgi:hypothetical protein
MFENNFQGQLSEEAVIYNQILLITGLSSRIYQDSSSNWTANCRNYVSAIDNMESTVIRHLDSEYIDNLKTIINHSRKKLQKYRDENPKHSTTAIGKEFEVAITIMYARRKYALIMKTLDDRGAFNMKAYNAIETPSDEELEDVGEQTNEQQLTTGV